MIRTIRHVPPGRKDQTDIFVATPHEGCFLVDVRLGYQYKPEIMSMTQRGSFPRYAIVYVMAQLPFQPPTGWIEIDPDEGHLFNFLVHLATTRAIIERLSERTLEEIYESCNEPLTQMMTKSEYIAGAPLAVLFYRVMGMDHMRSHPRTSAADAWEWTKSKGRFESPPRDLDLIVSETYATYQSADIAHGRRPDIGLVDQYTNDKLTVYHKECEVYERDWSVHAPHDVKSILGACSTRFICIDVVVRRDDAQDHQQAILIDTDTKNIEIVEPHGRCRPHCWCHMAAGALQESEFMTQWQHVGFSAPVKTQVRLQEISSTLVPYQGSCVPTTILYLDLRTRFTDYDPLLIQTWVAFLFSDPVVSRQYNLSWIAHRPHMKLVCIKWPDLINQAMINQAIN